MRVHSISHTPIDAPGGVPRFNRYLRRVAEEAGHEFRHWSWWDVPNIGGDPDLLETSKAELLSHYIMSTGASREDVFIGDGFWCGQLTRFGYRRVVSVAHGIWGHLTAAQAAAGQHPENPWLHHTQIQHRREHLRRGLPLVAVSEFIAEQMSLQWGFESTVINNAIDPAEIPPLEERESVGSTFWVVHGVNDRSNGNKGWSHVEALTDHLRGKGLGVVSLDELHARLGFSDKMQTLQHAHAAFIPSGFEGNSYFALECLMADLPVVCYDVGLFKEIKRWGLPVGQIMPLAERSPARGVQGFSDLLSNLGGLGKYQPRYTVDEVASFDSFRSSWTRLIDRLVTW